MEILDLVSKLNHEDFLRNGLIYFPDFCQLCLEKFRQTEEEEEEFYKIAFKVSNIPKYVLDRGGFQRIINFQLFCGTEPFPTDFRAKKYKINKHHITRADFCQLMKSLPVPVSDDDIEEMFNFADKNKDDKLSYKEFEVCIKVQSFESQESHQLCLLSLKAELFYYPILS